jgi:hypothetical protein
MKPLKGRLLGGEILSKFFIPYGQRRWRQRRLTDQNSLMQKTKYFVLFLSHMFGYMFVEQVYFSNMYIYFFLGSENFQVSIRWTCTIHSLIKKVFHKCPFPNYGPVSKMAYFIFWYFSTKFGTSVVEHEKIINWKFHWNRTSNKR